MDNEETQIVDVLKLMENTHIPITYGYEGHNKLKTDTCENELDTIYHLVESHAPLVRFTAVERYQKTLDILTHQNEVLSKKEKISSNCISNDHPSKIKYMLDCLSEMPKEWTLVQLTSEYGIEQNVEIRSEKCRSSGLHLTVLNCGANQSSPFTILLVPPVDITGDIIEIRQEMFDILRDNQSNLTKFRDKHKKKSRFVSKADQLEYVDDRNFLNSRLENLVKVIQNKLLKTWKCLFMGKFVDEILQEKVVKAVEDLLKEYNYQNISPTNKSLLICLVKGASYLHLTSSKNGLRYIFPKEEDKSIRRAFMKLMNDKEFNFADQKRHPVILVIDESLDFIPWEMIDILRKQPVSRISSLYFAYRLFMQYQNSIVNGFFELSSTNNATYMLNPGLDLDAMQQRMHKFFKYWRPDWSGIVGVVPTEDDFLKTLTSSDIFIYCGHGSGTQFLRGEVIQRTKTNSVVFLFGCGSIMLTSLGPQAEICSSYFNYLIASSPCVVGMLWIVTDYDTDSLATEIFSHWIPSQAEVHWSTIEKQQWAVNGRVKINKKSDISENHVHEPDLLRALANAKVATGTYLNRAACIARGLPVKIVA